MTYITVIARPTQLDGISSKPAPTTNIYLLTPSRCRWSSTHASFVAAGQSGASNFFVEAGQYDPWGAIKASSAAKSKL
jgi:hypothetical protein